MPEILSRDCGATIAYDRLEGRVPGVVFLPGFRSDRSGTKALALEQFCRERGRAYVRFDYQGHGDSSGTFEDGTIGLWAGDALAVLDRLTEGPQVLVGSSMGGWIMLLCARARSERIAGLLGIAPAPDFTEDSLWDRLDEEQRERILRDGRVEEPTPYSDQPHVYTRGLIEDGRRNLVMREALPVSCPVRILQGMRDDAVPWKRALQILDHVQSDDVEVTLIKSGDHRLSEPADIDRLCRSLDSLLASLS
ncbi:MAG: alpha/beta hydrolase [Acetobacterales bacterium]